MEEGEKGPNRISKSSPKSGAGREVGMVMASSGALLASVRHQAGALLLLWAAAAPQLPHSPHSFPTPKTPAPAGLAQLGTNQERKWRWGSGAGRREKISRDEP